MNREIKFRAWEKHAKRMAEITTFKWQSDHLYHQIYTRAIVNEKMIDEWYTYDFGSNSNGIILMQYTGLKDKNDKDIYEGDIVDNSYINPMTNNMVVQRYVIEWENGIYKMKFINAPHEAYDRYLWMSAKDVEVIGNIYENKELLEVENE